ncbi:NMD3 family-domain-containing protein [Zopfochytrium polystomum]|nr:NMD3 family-domain-containing protein [Zopfochytrium polystomum]
MEFVTLSLPEQQLQQQQHQQQPQLISQLSQQQQQQLSQQRILCASCGAVIAPNAANLCINCIRNDVDITEGIPKQAILNYCKGCDRYLQPPNIWVVAELESKELLTICLKKLKSGLAKVRLVDAGFIWTEPHSKRVKVKLTIQKEVFASTILQQVFVVEYVVSNQQCEECTRVAAQQTWKAVVQVRQKVAHKRTFLWLEQLILKHNAHQNTTNIKEAKDGIDFYYINRAHAVRMVEFLREMVPMRLKTSEQLISQDIHSGSANYRFSYSIEIVPICKDDLVCLPVKLARASSDISPLVLCSRVSNSLGLIDFNTLKSVDVRSTSYWDLPFTALCEAKDLVEFFVIDVQQERAPNASNRFSLAMVEIAPSKDLSQTMTVRTHLGRILRPGDHALGYDLRNANFNDAHFDAYVRRSTAGSAKRAGGGGCPDVVLVRKSYPNARKRSKKQGRSWKLKKITVEEEVEAIGKSKAEKVKAEMDYELFLRDLEEDPELRGMVNLYKGKLAFVLNLVWSRSDGTVCFSFQIQTQRLQKWRQKKIWRTRKTTRRKTSLRLTRRSCWTNSWME